MRRRPLTSLMLSGPEGLMLLVNQRRGHGCRGAFGDVFYLSTVNPRGKSESSNKAAFVLLALRTRDRQIH